MPVCVLQRVAVCRSVLQRVAVCRSVLQYVAVCCSVLRFVAVCFSALQWECERLGGPVGPSCVYCSVMYCAAEFCSWNFVCLGTPVLYVVVCCKVLQCV